MKKSTVRVEWPGKSRRRELEAIRWYLTGRLDVDTKLDLSLGNAVADYEYHSYRCRYTTPIHHPILKSLVLSDFDAAALKRLRLH